MRGNLGSPLSSDSAVDIVRAVVMGNLVIGIR